MTIVATSRWKVPNAATGQKWAKIALEHWRKSGATTGRVFRAMTGPNVGDWLFAVEFPDLATFETARTAFRARPDFAQMGEELAKAGDIQMDAGFLEEITGL